MDTLTMVEEAIANPGQEFATTCGRVHYKDGRLRWVHTQHTFAIDHYNLRHRWRRVPEQVDFMVALKAYNNGETIVCKWLEGEYSYSRKCNKYMGIVDDNKRAITASEILEGEWYIEEERYGHFNDD